MREALAFLTPLGRATALRPAALAWFPVVGALVGGAVGGVWWGAGEVWAPGVAAALAVAADLALTGMLHVDGLADSADGLLPHLDRDRRLKVMRSPDVGAFGVAVAGAALLLRWSLLASIEPDALLLAGVWAVSRTLMAVTLCRVTYARTEGLASPFVGGRPALPAGVGAVVGVGLAGVAAGVAGLGAAVAGVVTGAAVVAFAVRRVGGFTGDVLGAAGVVCETVALLVVAA